ncbi:MAG: T9SS type A sorting domain-containing protein [Crocinitomicaceae bacterium]|nr:T9SS type A sorting domain-containing protein [Crocinitomicaceae bacterium]
MQTSSNTIQQVPTLTNIKTVATSESSSMAVDLTGTVYVWGNNTEGQLGTGNNAVINFPFLNTNITNVDSIAGGKSHFVILRNDGTVFTVGNNDFGQLGQGNLTSSNTPLIISGMSNIVSIGAGEYHSFAINATGDFFVWGNNGSGQLGLDDLNNRLSPTLSPLRNVINAQGGATHSAFILTNGKVYTTGSNTYGQLGTGTFSNELSPIEINIQGARSISTGQYTTLVQRNDNSVFGFGNNIEGQLSSITSTLINTPEHIMDLDGVTFIEAGKSSSHVIYGENQSCISTPINTVMEIVPIVTIAQSNDTLTTIIGNSYQWYFEGNPIPGATAQSHNANTSGNYSVQVTFTNGCIGLSELLFHNMASLNDLSFGTITLHPNPTKSDINLRISNAAGSQLKISIMDQAGRIIQSSTHIPSQSMTISVTNLEPGIYYLLLNDNFRNAKTMKFIKVRNE